MAQQAIIPMREQPCPDHEKGKICMVCKDCDFQKVCVTCIATTHKRHHCIEIEEYVQIQKDSLKDLITEVKDISSIAQTRFLKTKALSERNSSNRNIIKRQLARKAERLKQLIDNWLTKNHKECDQLFTDNNKIITNIEKTLFDQSKDLNSVITRSEVALKSSSYEDMTSLEQALSSYTTDYVIPTVPFVNELELTTATNVDIATVLGNLQTIELDFDLQRCEISAKNIRRKEAFKNELDTFKGVFGDIPVTIKERKGGKHISQEEFFKEAQILRRLHHPNVIHLHGVIKSGYNPAIVIEDISKGYLLDFLRAEEEQLPLSLLLDFSIQIASGMEYVASKRIIHRDLAARNILMVNNTTVKVAEFSMAIELADDSEQWPPDDESDGPPQIYPIKWSAVEILEKGVFSVASDVWSFGVVVWEMVSQGSTPYQGMRNREALKHVTSGHRLQKPQQCPKNVFEVLQKCWDKDPKQRPTFEELGEVFEDILLSVKPKRPTSTTSYPTLIETDTNSIAPAANLNVSTPLANDTERRKKSFFSFLKQK